MSLNEVLVVVIGRNEGLRLQHCLTRLRADNPAAIVYVDSGSTDTSVAFAQGLGIPTVHLDPARPFTAARARNSGVEFARNHFPGVDVVQFLDGDCEMSSGWLAAALREMAQNPRTAVVCGRRRERYPDATVYNKLCDLEWDTPTGEVETCGGDSMMRLAALHEVGGFRETLIAGEEPELCLRLRAKGWKVMRIDAEMSIHDADMSTFSQWWRRAQRSGFALAEGIWLHGAGAERYCVRESASAIFWGALMPLFALLSLPFTPAGALLIVGLYGVQTLRIASSRGWTYGLFCMLQKLAESSGIAQFMFRKLFDKPVALIEYK